MKKISLTISFLISLFYYAQVGIKTDTPQKTLHVNGSLQVTNELNVGGNANTPGNAGTSGQVLVSNGTGQAPSWQSLVIPTLPVLSTGTVIAVNGVFKIAQEITAQMTADFSIAGSGSNPTTTLIGNLNNEIIDNENTYSGTASSNSFKVNEDGVYMVIMNIALSVTGTASPTAPVVGIWSNTDNMWIARVNDTYMASTTGRQTYTLITAIPMQASKTYSFRAACTDNFVIRAISSGSSGSGPVSQITVKRLK